MVMRKEKRRLMLEGFCRLPRLPSTQECSAAKPGRPQLVRAFPSSAALALRHHIAVAVFGRIRRMPADRAVALPPTARAASRPPASIRRPRPGTVSAASAPALSWDRLSLALLTAQSCIEPAGTPRA